MAENPAVDPQLSRSLPEDVRRRHDVAREFLQTLDAMRVRPTRKNGDVPLPVLHITGTPEAAYEVVGVLEERFKDGPFALVTVSAADDGLDLVGQASYAPLAAQLREVADSLGSTAPSGEAHLRFPLLNQLLWLLDLELAPSDVTKTLKRYVEREVRNRRFGIVSRERQGWAGFLANFRAYVEGPFLAYAAGATAISVFWGARLTTLLGVLAIVGILAVGIAHVAVLSRSWAGSHRYRWFCRQPYITRRKRGRRPRTFSEFALVFMEVRRQIEVAVAADQPRGEEDPADRKRRESARAGQEIEHLLINSFLEDLRQGYERRLWRFWRRVTWARTTYPVLVVEGESTRLVQRVEEVRATTCMADPLLVLAATGTRPPTAPPGAPASEDQTTTGVNGAGMLWRAWQERLAKDRTLGSRRHLQIDIDIQDAESLQKATVPVARRRTPLLARPAVPLLVVTALVLTALSIIVVRTSGYCAPGVHRTATNECVGITDEGLIVHDRLKSILAQIRQTNDEIEGSGRPYVTVIYASQLSLPASEAAGGDDLLAAIQGELAGIALRQRKRVENGKDGKMLQMRVLVANAGGQYRFAKDVAGDILKRFDEDETIIGVVGFDESRTIVKDAIDTLRSRAIPVITTAATYDELGKFGNGYASSLFPMAPPNSETARHAARWAKAGVPELGIYDAETAAVFVDNTEGDLYTTDLGNKFITEFNNLGGEATLFEYSGSGSIGQEINKLCTRGQPPDLFYYAGRSSQFGAFIENPGLSQCGGVTIIADDAVEQYVHDHAQEIGKKYIRFLYMPLASPDSWAAGSLAVVSPEYSQLGFYGELESFLSDLGPDNSSNNKAPSTGSAALAADAVNTLMSAADTAHSHQHDTADFGRLDRGGMLQELEALTSIDGYSGVIQLHGAKDGHHALNRPVLLIYVNQVGQQVLARQCGRLYAKQQAKEECS